MEFLRSNDNYLLVEVDGVYTIIEKSQDIAVKKTKDREEANLLFDETDNTGFEGFTPRFILEELPEFE